MAIGDARAAFFDAASTAVQLLERPELAGHWTDGSVLQQFSVAGRAGHLVRGMTTVERYLDRAETGENGISAGSYFHAVIRSADVEAVIESLRETWSRTRAPRAVVFCRTIAHAEEFAQLLREAGWRRCECLNSGQSRRERTILLSEFRDGRVPIVTTVDILNEGVDVPDVNIICFLRVTHSRRIFVQHLGRGSRVPTRLLSVMDWPTMAVERVVEREPCAPRALRALRAPRRANCAGRASGATERAYGKEKVYGSIP